MKLRQITSGFAYNEGAVLSIGKPSKLIELESLIEELGNTQIIIWVNFKFEAHQVIESLTKIGTVTTLYSETKDKDRSIEDFKTGRARFMVANPHSAAHGLTLVNCSTMIYYSLDYSYEAHRQSQHRIHRIGQTKTCLYIYLLAENTIDEDILNVLNGKKTLQNIIDEFMRKN